MSQFSLSLVFLIYGLAFFAMGLVVALERGRGTDERLRHALRPLAAFGILHGTHEWLEMFSILGHLPSGVMINMVWEGLRTGLLALSFLSLTAFGGSLLSPNVKIRRLSLLLPLLQAAIWVFGVLIMRGQFASGQELWDVVDVWARYVLGIPSALVASLGLIAQQRAFRQAGMAQFGRDSLWAAMAFAWYGVIGQIFTRSSGLRPSQLINQALFLDLFGFPVQILRASAAWVAAYFIIRSLRSFEVETQQKIAQLQAARLEEAERREALRGKLLRRIVSAQERERQRIARELHDETGQALTALGLGLRGIATTVNQDSSRAADNLRQLEALAARSLDELQRLIADLRPSHLDDLGLSATLRWYTGEVQNRFSLPIHFSVKGDENHTLPPPVKTALFRIVQEALTNVVKHAQASQVEVTLSYFPHQARVMVLDNGQGFSLAELKDIETRPSWGLLGMQERASLLGGEFKIESALGQGTCIEVQIPFQHENMLEEVNDDHPTPVSR